MTKKLVFCEFDFDSGIKLAIRDFEISNEDLGRKHEGNDLKFMMAVLENGELERVKNSFEIQSSLFCSWFGQEHG